MKRAPMIVPKKQGWKTVFDVAVTCIWVFVSVVAAQLVVGKLMLAVLGAENLSQPVWVAVYSAIVYIVAMILIILVPIAFIKKHATNKKKQVLEEAKEMPAGQELRESLGLTDLFYCVVYFGGSARDTLYYFPLV